MTKLHAVGRFPFSVCGKAAVSMAETRAGVTCKVCIKALEARDRARKWQQLDLAEHDPLLVRWCDRHGFTPKEAVESGAVAGFMAWMSTSLMSWRTEQGLEGGDGLPMSKADRARFDKWLDARERETLA